MGGRSGLPITHNMIVANILKEADLATDDQWQAGQNWYAEAQAEAARISRATSVPGDTVAGAIAALSPRVSWSRNLTAARALCAGEDKPSGVMGSSWARGMRVLDGSVVPLRDWQAKIGRFYRNLTGDPHAVTVDVWAWRVAMGEDVPDHVLTRAGAYDTVERAYQRAADSLSVYPCDLQAIVWLHRRYVTNVARMARARAGAVA